jgi:hydroxymethylbilane synthase
VLVVNDTLAAESLDELPRGSRVGTSSLRRRAQLLHRRADLEVVELRGNVPTRLRKVDEGQVHAAILAGAGLKRLEAEQRIDAWLDAPEWLPAAGQGVIAVEARTGDARMAELLAPLNHAPSAFAAEAERSLLAALDGGCQVPIGALLIGEGPEAVLYALVSDLHGKRMVRGSLAIGSQSASDAGKALAATMRADGATEILASLREVNAKIPSPQPE